MCVCVYVIHLALPMALLIESNENSLDIFYVYKELSRIHR